MSHVFVWGGARYELSFLPLVFASFAVVLSLCSLAWIARRRNGERGIAAFVAAFTLGALALATAPSVSAFAIPARGDGPVGPTLPDVVEPVTLAIAVALATLAVSIVCVGMLVAALRAPIDGSRRPGLGLALLALVATLPLSLQLSVLAASWHLPVVTAELPAAATGADAELRALALGKHAAALFWPTRERIVSTTPGARRGEVALRAPFVRVSRDVTVHVGDARGEVALSPTSSWRWTCQRPGATVFLLLRSASRVETLDVSVVATRQLNGLPVYELRSRSGRTTAWSVAGRTFAQRSDGAIGPLMDGENFAPLAGMRCSNPVGGIPLWCSARVRGNAVAGIASMGMVIDEGGEMSCQLTL